MLSLAMECCLWLWIVIGFQHNINKHMNSSPENDKTVLSIFWFYYDGIDISYGVLDLKQLQISLRADRNFTSKQV